MSTNTPTTSPTFEQRLAALERSARLWKVAAVGMAVVIVGMVSMGAAEQEKISDVIAAKSFLIFNKEGTECVGRFGTSTDADGKDFGGIKVESHDGSSTAILPGFEPIVVSKK